jgi:transcriptional regulator with XRE-family HTH domain
MAYLAFKPGILDKIKEGRAIATDADMARMIGCSPETYGRVKRGDQAPTREFIAAVSLRFLMPLDTIIHPVEGTAPSTYKPEAEKVAA